ncbi:hypothetical protein [Pseudomonas sichuanensis]|uniref:hypothetical protein n=1 Tax=Pseudomonas sichuanensis TaxID=2213015 RepID=UPI00215F5B71|nr:hypothetical protein [Pseudomonas sichuanensis]UVL86906.1 hypothetical protein LOY51_13915 [Pseudomonas sichuanensis]
MRFRGEKFRAWVDPALHLRHHEETLDDGRSIDVQTRLSRTGKTQLFIGVYSKTGDRIVEESYSSRPNESMIGALVWGVLRAKTFVAGGRG